MLCKRRFSSNRVVTVGLYCVTFSGRDEWMSTYSQGGYWWQTKAKIPSKSSLVKHSLQGLLVEHGWFNDSMASLHGISPKSQSIGSPVYTPSLELSLPDLEAAEPVCLFSLAAVTMCVTLETVSLNLILFTFWALYVSFIFWVSRGAYFPFSGDSYGQLVGTCSLQSSR